METWTEDESELFVGWRGRPTARPRPLSAGGARPRPPGGVRRPVRPRPWLFAPRWPRVLRPRRAWLLYRGAPYLYGPSVVPLGGTSARVPETIGGSAPIRWFSTPFRLDRFEPRGSESRLLGLPAAGGVYLVTDSMAEGALPILVGETRNLAECWYQQLLGAYQAGLIDTGALPKTLWIWFGAIESPSAGERALAAARQAARSAVLRALALSGLDGALRSRPPAVALLAEGSATLEAPLPAPWARRVLGGLRRNR